MNVYSFNEVVPNNKKEKLIAIQKKIEDRNIGFNNVFHLITTLDGNERRELKELYRNQIQIYNENIEMYKNNMLSIREKLKKI